MLILFFTKKLNKLKYDTLLVANQNITMPKNIKDLIDDKLLEKLNKDENNDK